MPPSPGDSATLLTLLRVRGRTRADTLERGARRVGALLRVQIDNQTRVLRLDVRTRYPALSADIANRVVEFLNEFNAGTRQSQARERREFVEGRIAEVRQSLRDAEDGLRRFYETNRSWQQAPEMTVAEGRLRQQVELARQTFEEIGHRYAQGLGDYVQVLTALQSLQQVERTELSARKQLVSFRILLYRALGGSWMRGLEPPAGVRVRPASPLLRWVSFHGS